MSLRRDAPRIYEAERQMIVRRFVALARIPPADAERWVGQWESHAERAGLRRASDAYWAAGLRWIGVQRGDAGSTG